MSTMSGTQHSSEQKPLRTRAQLCCFAYSLFAHTPPLSRTRSAFLALSSVHPVTHAVANTIKRVAVIVVSVLYFRNPITLQGAAGSTIAIIGVLLYSLAKAQSSKSAAPKKDLKAARELKAALPPSSRLAVRVPVGKGS